MNENNLPNIDGEENTAPVAEESVEAVEEENTAFEAEAEEETEEAPAFTFDGEIPDEASEAFDFEVKKAKKSNAGKIVAIIAAVVVVLAAVGYAAFRIVTRNPYNEMGYINVSGRTIKDVAQQAGYASVDEFLAEYGLPADMPEDTDESAAYYNIPVKKIAEMYGMDVATLKEMLGLGDDVTDETPWGVAEGKAPLGKYIGEDNIEAFKTEYGLADDVNADTLWGEVRNTVDKKTLENQQAAQKNAEKQNSDAAAVGDDAEGDVSEGETESDAE